MSFACRTSDHQCACMHEARPSTPNPGEHLFEARAHSRKEILVNHEKWLDGPHGVIILYDQIAVLESIPQRVFDQLVIAMIFSLIGESRSPMRQGGNLVPGSNSERHARTCCRAAVSSLKHRCMQRCTALPSRKSAVKCNIVVVRKAQAHAQSPAARSQRSPRDVMIDCDPQQIGKLRRFLHDRAE